MSTSWHSLISNKENNSNDLISGEWFTVRFIPDHVAGEVFNIGVVFIDEYKNAHYRLINNADAFSCLFGEIGKANINFLLNVVDQVLSDNSYLVTPSSSIVYSSRKTAQGDSVNDILDDLFNSMISLVCRNEVAVLTHEVVDLMVVENEKFNLSTKNLRHSVFGRMKKDYEALYNKVYNKEPYEITNPYSKKKMLIDMPIRSYGGLARQKRQDYYGSVVSAAYLNEVHRIHQINYVGATNVINCCEQLGRGVKTALVIYLPPVDYYRFTESLRRQVENELDRCLYGLHQMSKDGYQIKIEVEESPEACLEQIVEFVS